MRDLDSGGAATETTVEHHELHARVIALQLELAASQASLQGERASVLDLQRELASSHAELASSQAALQRERASALDLQRELESSRAKVLLLERTNDESVQNALLVTDENALEVLKTTDMVRALELKLEAAKAAIKANKRTKNQFIRAYTSQRYPRSDEAKASLFSNTAIFTQTHTHTHTHTHTLKNNNSHSSYTTLPGTGTEEWFLSPCGSVGYPSSRHTFVNGEGPHSHTC